MRTNRSRDKGVVIDKNTSKDTPKGLGPMPTVLRIAPQSSGKITDDSPGQLPRPVPQPIPLMAFDIEQQTPQGKVIDRIILWRNEDAPRCGSCPRGKCTFQAGPEGQGNCVVRRQASSIFLAER